MHCVRAAGVAVMLLLLGALAACERTPTEQRGYRGLGMLQVGNAQQRALSSDVNALPTALRRATAAGPTAGDEYTNVKELGDLSKPEFARLMLSFKSWIAPEEGCGYCHNVPDYASDDKPPKLAARAMIRMTREINSRWAPHVKATGVTCYTCHRGQAIPPKVWFASPQQARGLLVAPRHEARMPTPTASLSLILSDVLSEFLLEDNSIRVVSTAPLPGGSTGTSTGHIRDARSTYALMTVMADSLGVNCTYCHNSRAFAAWDESTPQRVTAWHGIRMTRDLNRNHLAPLASLLEPTQLGPSGDGPKVYCATCHLGVSRPLNGVNMVKDFPELIGTKAQLAAAPPPAAALHPAPRPAPTSAPAVAMERP
jgi:photosynthetic reaction center cytochrome c subunit